MDFLIVCNLPAIRTARNLTVNFLEVCVHVCPLKHWVGNVRGIEKQKKRQLRRTIHLITPEI